MTRKTTTGRLTWCGGRAVVGRGDVSGIVAAADAQTVQLGLLTSTRSSASARAWPTRVLVRRPPRS
jgi:hypothetical protein